MGGSNMEVSTRRDRSKSDTFKLDIPLDASEIEGFKPEQNIKVLVIRPDGTILDSQIVKFNARGTGLASFTFSEKPGALRVIVGPEAATDDELQGLQTLYLNVSARQWADIQELKLPPLRISAYYWFWWLRWCRNFTIRGRVLCRDGRPVPGAKVCAYDIDAWWWWSSKHVVGCDTTDTTGAFEIKFRWCCGWWPWWWWRYHFWHLEPILAERIIPALQQVATLPIPLPDPIPDLDVFKQLLGEEEFATLNIAPKVATTLKAMSIEGTSETLQAKHPVDPVILDTIRDKLLKRIPLIPELECLRIWPWWPWRPWWDCTPDIIFRVTQDCELPGTVVVDEGFNDTRWNVPTTLDVTLVANDKACCLGGDGDDPEGACVVTTNVCWNPINHIGGNPGAPVAPAGYLNPGDVSNYGDRPYGGNVRIEGQVGNDVDYYEFEISDDNGVTWQDMPPAAVGDIPRQYWIPATNTFVVVPFLTTIDGRLVFESRQHYEATHDPGTWGLTRFWMAQNYYSLMNWLTQTPFTNGTYQLRVKGWRLVGGHLANPQILPVCSTQTQNMLVLRIDNRLVGPASGHPASTPDHPCGPGTVHYCTMEPDTDFLSIKIIHTDATEIEVGACSNAPVNKTDILQVDFMAYDPEGHLAYYTLQATYGENLAINLLGLPGVTLTPLGGAPVPAAVQVGPTYANARSASLPPHGGAVAPIWRGGSIRLQVPAYLAFPESCCYQLELRAHKRTIVNCDHTLWNHINYSEFSLMITV
jgi:hypothetical protein